MADILIDLPDDVIERLKKRAAMNGRELDDELTLIVMGAMCPDVPPSVAWGDQPPDIPETSRNGQSD